MWTTIFGAVSNSEEMLWCRVRLVLVEEDIVVRFGPEGYLRFHLDHPQLLPFHLTGRQAALPAAR